MNDITLFTEFCLKQRAEFFQNNKKLEGQGDHLSNKKRDGDTVYVSLPLKIIPMNKLTNKTMPEQQGVRNFQEWLADCPALYFLFDSMLV